MGTTLWSDFVAGLFGDFRESRAEQSSTSTVQKMAKEEAMDALDTLQTLRNGEFILNKSSTPLMQQLQSLYAMGLLTKNPDAMADGIDVGHDLLLTEQAHEFLNDNGHRLQAE